MIYFDYAATSFPKSKEVTDAVCDALNNCGNPGRGGHSPSLYGSKVMFDCRNALSSLLGCMPERVVLTPGCTFSLNAAINGLLKKGKVIMSSLEHNSVCRPLYMAEKTKGIRLAAFDVDIYDDGKTVFNVKKLCKNGVDVAVITHASNVCGKILPVYEISKEVHSHGGIVILDCAQSGGHIPIDFESTGADVICVAGHKGLAGPMGVGALGIGKNAAGKIKPFLYGGSGVASENKYMPKVLPEGLEAGTQNVMGFAGLTAGINGLGSSNEREIFGYIVESLKKTPGITLYGCPSGDLSGFLPVLLFNIDKLGSDSVVQSLSEKGICVRGGKHCAPLAHKALGSRGGVRISVGAGNTMEEAKTLVSQIQALVPAT